MLVNSVLDAREASELTMVRCVVWMGVRQDVTRKTRFFPPFSFLSNPGGVSFVSWLIRACAHTEETDFTLLFSSFVLYIPSCRSWLLLLSLFFLIFLLPYVLPSIRNSEPGATLVNLPPFRRYLTLFGFWKRRCFSVSLKFGEFLALNLCLFHPVSLWHRRNSVLSVSALCRFQWFHSFSDSYFINVRLFLRYHAHLRLKSSLLLFRFSPRHTYYASTILSAREKNLLLF